MTVRLDPAADMARRAWLPCPHCDPGRACADCREGRNCDDHWQYLLGSAAHVSYLQCPECLNRWEHDARKAS
jgi:hypothetical protein